MPVTHLSSELISLFTLVILEVILGVDNLVFIAVVSGRLPTHQRALARKIGLFLAWMIRLVLLASAVWIMQLSHPWFYIQNFSFSGRDLLLLSGGLFLLYKATAEIHAEFETHTISAKAAIFAQLVPTILQIGLFDFIFSLDSVLTAIALTQNFLIMAMAITIAILVMLFCSEFTSRFIQKNPSIRMLAWSLLLLIGLALIADGLHFHIPRGYVYFAVCFSVLVEMLNIMRKNRKKKQDT